MLPKGGTNSSGKQFCGIFCGVNVCTVERVLHEHDESDMVSGLKMPVGPRWREFQCLRRRGPAGGRGRRGAGMKFSPAIFMFEFVYVFGVHGWFS